MRERNTNRGEKKENERGRRIEEEMREMGEKKGGCMSGGREVKRKRGGYVGGREKKKKGGRIYK